jgi:hypothetical protein
MNVRTLLRVALPLSVLVAGLALGWLVLKEQRRIDKAGVELRGFNTQLEGKSATLAKIRSFKALYDKSGEFCKANPGFCIRRDVFSGIYKLTEQENLQLTRAVFSYPEAHLSFTSEPASRRVEERLIAHGYPAQTAVSAGQVELHVGKQQ